MCIRSSVIQMRKHKYFLNHRNIAHYQANNWSIFPKLISKILTLLYDLSDESMCTAQWISLGSQELITNQ